MISDITSVVMIIQTFHPVIGGAETQCLQLCKTLKERGVQVKVFTERWKGLAAYEEIEGIPVKRLGRGGPRLIHSIFFMLSIIFYMIVRSRNYQVIHVHLAASHAVAAALIGKIFKKRVLVKIGGGTEVGEIALSRKKLTGKLKLWALGKLKPQFVILNNDQRKELTGFGLEQVPTELIPNGVDTNFYHLVTPEQKSALREKLGWQGLVFLYTGRFSDDKIKVTVLENFLKGWTVALQQRKDLSFYLVGQGPLAEDYRMLISQMNLEDSVHLLEARNDISMLYQAADVFVLPSQTEGLSNSLLEAMASQLPVLASRVPGIVDIIQENVHGFLFDPFSPNEVKTCLEKILRQPSMLIEMGKKSRSVAMKYSINNTVDRYLELYGAS